MVSASWLGNWMQYTLISDRVADVAAERLREAGLTVKAPGQMSRPETLRAVRQSVALIVRSATQVDAELLTLAEPLRFVVRAGVGVDNVDLAQATERGVIVMNTPGANSLAVAEYTFGLMVALMRHIAQAHASLSRGEWERQDYQGSTLSGKTLGLYGFGRIGQAVAARARAFAMEVLAHDPFLPTKVFNEHGVEGVPLNELWARADILSLHAEVNEETRGIVNAASIAQMKSGVRILNTARGPLIDSEALLAALEVGQVAGAALDVYPKEPPPKHYPLLLHPRVLHTPHLAASAIEVQEATACAAAETLIAALQEGRFENVCNPAVLDA